MTREFDCASCGRHVISVGAVVDEIDECLTCRWLAEWIADPAEREMLRQKLCATEPEAATSWTVPAYRGRR